jgi:hypothetical protein
LEEDEKTVASVGHGRGDPMRVSVPCATGRDRGPKHSNGPAMPKSGGGASVM